MTQRPIPIPVVACLALAWGCTTASPPSAAAPAAPAAATGLERAQRALERGKDSEAIAELLLVAGRCPATPAERHALLTAAALALDPGNDTRQIDLGASLAARYLATTPAGVAERDRPLARALYLLALELGADAAPPTGCGGPASDSAAMALLPRIEAPSVPERIKTLERELTRLRDELLRIRRTLEPS